MIATTHSLTSATPKRPSAVASYGHTLGLVGIAIAVAALGALAQARPTTGGSLTSTHASALPAYVSALVMEALLVCYVWAGVRKRGVTLAALSVGRWSGRAALPLLAGLSALAPRLLAETFGSNWDTYSKRTRRA